MERAGVFDPGSFAKYLSLTPKSLGPQGDSVFNLVF